MVHGPQARRVHKLDDVRIDTEGADLVVELEAESELHLQHLLARVAAILGEKLGIDTMPAGTKRASDPV